MICIAVVIEDYETAKERVTSDLWNERQEHLAPLYKSVTSNRDMGTTIIFQSSLP